MMIMAGTEWLSAIIIYGNHSWLQCQATESETLVRTLKHGLTTTKAEIRFTELHFIFFIIKTTIRWNI